MTPAARCAAAIEVLDQINGGAPAEQALTTWARGHRFAGSKDRAAIRDHVFDVLRRRRSVAALGGGKTGRNLMLGLLRQRGDDPETLFGRDTYGPDALTDTERASGRQPVPGAEALDMPDWLWPLWCDALGDEAETAANGLRERAPMWLRVNQRRSDREGAAARLANEGIETARHPEVATALQVMSKPRRVKAAAAFLEGLVEVQDAASQAAMALLRPYLKATVLDYCAGGGGKALALADISNAQITAHDLAPQRMRDIGPRAKRAGVVIEQLAPADLSHDARFDMVLCDAPCTGSGTWRRSPDAKWRLTPAGLADYRDQQQNVLRRGAAHVAVGGVLAYATCSVLQEENAQQVSEFLAEHPGFSLISYHRWVPSHTHDGFFLAVMHLT